MEAVHQAWPFVDYMDRLVASESSPGEIRGETIALTAVLC
jgi:hypothetical protein